MPRVVSIRMSSGPSLRKLKPRLASSTWGDEMPRSSRMPSTCVTPRAASASTIVAKAVVHDRKRGSSICSAVAIAWRSLSKAIRRPCGRQLRQDQPAVTAAAEGAIYISTGCARAFEAERIDCFIQQHRAMLQFRHRDERSCMCLRRRNWKGHRACRRRRPMASSAASLAASQISKWVPMPSIITSFSRPTALRSSGEISTRPDPSISTSQALPRKMRCHARADIGQAAIFRDVLPTPGAGRTTGNRAGVS
jgi:hypothetical protein